MAEAVCITARSTPVDSELKDGNTCTAKTMQARVTTKYNIPNLSSSAYTKTKPTKKEQEDEGYGTDKDKTVQPRIPRATITLKTYDPVSGVTLKFKTDRAADVGRTIAGLGNLGRQMAALPPKAEGMC